MLAKFSRCTVCQKDKEVTAVALPVVVLAAQVTSTEESLSTWKGTTLIGKSSTPGYSPLSIEMNQTLSVAYCVNSVNAISFCKEEVLEQGLLALSSSSKRHDPTPC